jgi:hypothetical protein
MNLKLKNAFASFLLFLGFSISLNAQQNVVTSGINISDSKFEINYTIGDLFSIAESTTDYAFFGLQIPFESFEASSKQELPYTDISILPNPTKGLLYLSRNKINDLTDVLIFDFQGKKLADFNFTDSQLILDLSDYQNGLYLIVLTDHQNFNAAHKIIKL